MLRGTPGRSVINVCLMTVVAVALNIDHLSLSLSLTGGNLSAVPPSEQDPDECELFQRKCIQCKSLGTNLLIMSLVFEM